jgi:DNA-binding transcriptional MerR regulator
MNMLTLQQVLDKSKKAEVPISKRTFEYYQSLGFLPKPHKVVGEKGRGLYGYYEPIVIDIVKKIYKLKKAGHSLKEIKEISEKEVLEKYRKILKEWGLSGRWDKGSVLLDSSEIISGTESQMLKNYLKKKGVKGTSVYTEKGIAETLRETKKEFEADILERLKWWHANEEIEYEVVDNILDEAYGAMLGIELVIQKMKGSNEKEIMKVVDTYAETKKIYDKALSRLEELEEIFAKKSKEQT